MTDVNTPGRWLTWQISLVAPKLGLSNFNCFVEGENAQGAGNPRTPTSSLLHSHTWHKPRDPFTAHTNAPQDAEERAIKCAALLFFSQCYTHTLTDAAFPSMHCKLHHCFEDARDVQAHIAALSRGIRAAACFEPCRNIYRLYLKGMSVVRLPRSLHKALPIRAAAGFEPCLEIRRLYVNATIDCKVAPVPSHGVVRQRALDALSHAGIFVAST